MRKNSHEKILTFMTTTLIASNLETVKKRFFAAITWGCTGDLRFVLTRRCGGRSNDAGGDAKRVKRAKRRGGKKSLRYFTSQCNSLKVQASSDLLYSDPKPPPGGRSEARETREARGDKRAFKGGSVKRSVAHTCASAKKDH